MKLIHKVAVTRPGGTMPVQVQLLSCKSRRTPYVVRVGGPGFGGDLKFATIQAAAEKYRALVAHNSPRVPR